MPSNCYDTEPVVDDQQPQESRALELRSPKVPVSLVELATMKGQAIEIIQARVQVWETARKAALRLTWPEDWLLFRDREGRVIGFLSDAGCERVRGILGIEIFGISRPEKIAGADPLDFYYVITGSGRCALTNQIVENIEGGRSSKDDVCKNVTGAALDMLVRKSARANLDGGITRELAGLGSVPSEEIAAAWEGSGRKVDNCRRGRGFGSGAERAGADLDTGAGVKQSEGPKCPKCGASMKFKPAGQTKAGKKYGAFWSCSQYPDCKGSVKQEEWQKPAKPEAEQPKQNQAAPQTSTSSTRREPGEDTEPPITKDEIPF